MSGEAAALTVALLWACGSFLFAFASGAIGSMATNRLRISVAMLVLFGIHFALEGAPFPRGVGAEPLAVLALSGLIGLLFGDGCYFRALVLIGPRLATLTMSFVPALVAILGWVFLGESLGPRALLGMAITIGGIVWVVVERPRKLPAAPRLGAGVAFGFGGALGQAVGYVLAKHALSEVMPLSATVVRMTSAAIGAWLLALAMGHARRGLDGLGDRRVCGALVSAALLGPVFGVWLSLYAAAHTATAIAATLMAMVPIVVLPLGLAVRGDRPSLRAVLGALVAVSGVVLLVTRGN